MMKSFKNLESFQAHICCSGFNEQIYMIKDHNGCKRPLCSPIFSIIIHVISPQVCNSTINQLSGDRNKRTKSQEHAGYKTDNWKPIMATDPSSKFSFH